MYKKSIKDLLLVFWVIFAPIILAIIRYRIFPRQGDGLLGGLEILLLPFYWAGVAIVFFISVMLAKLIKQPVILKVGKGLILAVTILLAILYIVPIFYIPAA
jgi:hypothetical protein